MGQTKLIRDIMRTNEVAVNFYELSSLMERGRMKWQSISMSLVRSRKTAFLAIRMALELSA